MHKLTLAVLISTLFSFSAYSKEKTSVGFSFNEQRDTVSHAKYIQLASEAVSRSSNDRTAYQAALLRQTSTEMKDRLCMMKYSRTGRVTSVGTKKLVVCQFLFWHNLNIARGLVPNDLGIRFSPYYFHNFIKTNL